MTTPVFVIHGIGNRVEKDFDRTVADLAAAVGGGLTAHPLFWGDLGARYDWVADTVPGAPDTAETRDVPAVERDLDAALARILVGDGPPDEVRDGGAPAAVLDAATATLAADDEGIRDGDPLQVAALRDAIDEHWSDTRWLSLVDDEELLREIGAAVAGPLTETAVGPPPDQGEELRDEELRAPDVRGFVRRRLHELDRVVGATFGAAGRRLNTRIRTQFLPPITRALGDVIVYQRHRDEIQDHVRELIAEVDPDLGCSRENPVDVLAHSLGGVIVFDMATSGDPLWVRRLVTFGSQAPFFHVCDPRGGTLTPYDGTGPIRLPESIGAWTNLWEPLDPVAFVAKRIFRLHDGSSPDDREVPHLFSSGLWTHTDYWTIPCVAEAIGTALGRP
jgi:hypothetical protein